MPHFTVVQQNRVLRLNAKSIQALTQALRAGNQRWLGIHEDKEAK